MSLLDRYILRDILKTLLLTASVLVTVIAFGAAIKPLADDQLLSAAQVVKYIGLAMIPMLQFALPFAAGFAATLVMHRLSADNEVTAMSVSGMSYRRVARSVFMLGLTLLVLMVGLTQWIIPRFWGLMEEMIAADVTRIFEASISRGEPFEMGGIQIFADQMLVVDNPPDTDADTRLVLLHVAAAELDSQRRIVMDVTAQQATVDMYRRDNRTYLKLAISDPIIYQRSIGQLGQAEELKPPAIVVNNALSDNPLTMSQGRLLELYADPDGFSQIIETKQVLAAAIRDAEMFRLLDERLAREGRIVFELQGPLPRTYVIEAAGIDGGTFRVGDGEVRVSERSGAVEVRAYRAADVVLRRSGTSTLAATTFELELTNGVVVDPSGELNPRARVVLDRLVVPDDGIEDLTAMTSGELIERAATLEVSTDDVTRAVARIEHYLRELKDDIVSKLNERYALSVTAPLLLALGALLAMFMRRSLPLTVYLWAFLPSVVNLITISSGAQLIRDGRPIGIVVLWAGNAVLVLLSLFTYWRLSRN